MNFELTADQEALVSAIDKLARQFEAKPTEFHGFALAGAKLERELEEGEYFDLARIPELGPLAAALAVERLARLPYAAETAFSMLVRPQLPGEWPRPIALVEEGRPGRFVAQARTILVVDGQSIGIAQPAEGEVQAVDSLFAYPMGKLRPGIKRHLFHPTRGRDRSQVAACWLRAAEASGLLHAAIASVRRASHPAQAIRAATGDIPGAAAPDGRVHGPGGRRPLARLESRGYR